MERGLLATPLQGRTLKGISLAEKREDNKVIDDPVLGPIVWRPRVYTRLGTSFFTCVKWRSDSVEDGYRLFVEAKKSFDMDYIEAVGWDLASMLTRLGFNSMDFVTYPPQSVVTESNRYFAGEIASVVAQVFGVPVKGVFNKRLRHGASHSPRKAVDRPPATMNGVVEVAGKQILLVDDLVTSGATMRECLDVLRRKGATAFGAVWVEKRTR